MFRIGLQGAGSVQNNFVAGLTGGEHEAQVMSELGFCKSIDLVELGMGSLRGYG